MNKLLRCLALIARWVLSVVLIFAGSMTPITLALMYGAGWLMLAPVTLVLAGMSVTRLLDGVI